MCVFCVCSKTVEMATVWLRQSVCVVDYFKMKEIECYFVFLVFSLKYSDKVAKDA